MFCFQDADDLKFEKGEVLSILRKDEDQWWTARNSRGEEGQIPVPYVEEYTKESKEAIEKEVKQKKTQSCEIPAQPYAQPQPVVPQITQVRKQCPLDDQYQCQYYWHCNPVEVWEDTRDL